MKTQFTNKNTHISRTDILQKQCGRELLFIGARKRGPKARGNFKFRVSEMPFPGLWGSFDRMLMVRKKRFSMSKFTICLQFIVTIYSKILFYYYCRNFPNGQPDFLNMLSLKKLGGGVNHPQYPPRYSPVCITAATYSIYMHGLTNKYTS